MADTPDDDLEYFNELLKKGGTAWLMEQLKALGMDPEKLKANPSSPLPAADGLAQFFRDALTEEKATTAKLRERLDDVLDLLTPEQRTLLKSPKSVVVDDPNSPLVKKESPNPNPPSDPPPPPPAATAKKLFRRL